MHRALVVLISLLLAGCDAGNRGEPGGDNALGSPEVRIVAPYEGQAVVPEAPGRPVLAHFDLAGARLGRGAGSTLRYRLDRLDASGAVAKAGEWTAVAAPQQNQSLGVLEAGAYALTAEVLDADGKPWTREEAGSDGKPRPVHPAARSLRRFTVATGWQK